MPYTARTPVLTLRDSTITSSLLWSAGIYALAAPKDQVITTLADGRMVVVWSGTQYGDNGVRFQILDPAGIPLTQPQSVFGVDDASVRVVSIAPLADGGFVIRGDGQMQRYTSVGLMNGPAISTPTGTGGEVAALGQGFVVATLGAVTTGGANYTINLDVFGVQGEFQSQRAIANIAGSSIVRDLQIAVRQGADPASTRIVTVWSEIPAAPYPITSWVEVKFQVVDGNGRAIGASIQLGSTYALNIQPDVTFLADGSFVVCWVNGYVNRNSGPFLTGIHSQHFSTDGIALGAVTSISGSYTPSVTALADGGYVLTWHVDGSGYGQQFDAQGNLVGSQFQLGVADVNGAVALSDGRVAVLGGLQFQILSPNINVQIGNNANNVFQGAAGDDTYNGVTGDDTIRGGGGNDLLRGDEGNDFLYGEAGNDILVGGAGNDVIDGGDGYDVIQLDKPLLSYFVERTANGFRLWDGAASDTVTNVEGVYSADGRVYSIADLEKLSFNALAYIAGYTDLANGFGANAAAGYQHYIQSGRAEGRTIRFDGVSYLAANYDLAAGFGYDPIAAAKHYIEHGRSEGRRVVGFDALLYGASNPDLARTFGASVDALTQHFVEYGAREGRPVSGFDALLYAASNGDLVHLYGTNVNLLTNHYLIAGADEGRPLRTFDPLVYAAGHADLARYFGTDAKGALLHYLNYGLKEGRAATGFDSTAYLLTYSDLAGIGSRNALLHWLNSGADEGRIGDDLFGREQGTSHGFVSGVAQASLERASDHDWFEIGFVAGFDAAIRLSGVTSGGGTLTDGWLRLYNEAGVLVATNRGTAGTSDAEIIFRPTVSGRYFLVVAGETDTQTGTYRVTVSGAPAAAAQAVPAFAEGAVHSTGEPVFDITGDVPARVGADHDQAWILRSTDILGADLIPANDFGVTHHHDWLM